MDCPPVFRSHSSFIPDKVRKRLRAQSQLGLVQEASRDDGKDERVELGLLGQRIGHPQEGHLRGQPDQNLLECSRSN